LGKSHQEAIERPELGPFAAASNFYANKAESEMMRAQRKKDHV